MNVTIPAKLIIGEPEHYSETHDSVPAALVYESGDVQFRVASDMLIFPKGEKNFTAPFLSLFDAQARVEGPVKPEPKTAAPAGKKVIKKKKK